MDAITQFESLKASSDFVFLVYYRGQWCPFCVAYLQDFQSITDEIVKAGGKPVIVTSEEASQLDVTRKRSGYQGSAIVDTENLLAKHFKESDLLNVAISSKDKYPHGMAQPAVLVIRADGEKLFSWAINPSLMNLNGAKDRPSLKEIWEDVHRKLNGEHVAPRSNYSKQTFSGVMLKKVFG